MASALPAMNVALVRPLSSALCVAARTLSALISTPATRSNSLARVIPNSPAPQYASTRKRGERDGSSTGARGESCERTWVTSDSSTLLLHWKNVPAAYSKLCDQRRAVSRDALEASDALADRPLVVRLAVCLVATLGARGQSVSEQERRATLEGLDR